MTRLFEDMTVEVDAEELQLDLMDVHQRYQQSRADMYQAAIDGGGALVKAKLGLRHGEFTPFVKRAGVQMRTAQNWMSLAKSGVKSETVSLLGGLKSTYALAEAYNHRPCCISKDTGNFTARKCQKCTLWLMIIRCAWGWISETCFQDMRSNIRAVCGTPDGMWEIKSSCLDYLALGFMLGLVDKHWTVTGYVDHLPQSAYMTKREQAR